MFKCRNSKYVVADWAEELSQRLGRTSADIVARGLSAYDFSADRSVEIRTAGGSTFRFQFAFSLIRPETGIVVVFSEHDGYVEFVLAEDDVVSEIEEKTYTHQ